MSRSVSTLHLIGCFLAPIKVQRSITELSHHSKGSFFLLFDISNSIFLALLRNPQDGLHAGVIDAVDSVNNTYRITFDRVGLGTHTVPDYEVLSNQLQDTLPLSSFQQKSRPRYPLCTPPRGQLQLVSASFILLSTGRLSVLRSH